MNILISTIVRNRGNYLPYWLSLLKNLVLNNKNHNFFLSVYENDSTDNSTALLKSFDFSFFSNFSIQFEKLNLPYFGSVVDEQRVKILAEARNRTIFNNSFLNYCDYVLSIEPDIIYNPDDMKLILDDNEFDILSARSIHSFNTSDTHICDTWGTRLHENMEWWEQNIVFKNEILNVWSTYNGFCKYKADLIKDKKIAFSPFNKRLNKFDCDTAVICENFREHGFNKIGLVGHAIVKHDVL
jgi:hypothetical protein